MHPTVNGSFGGSDNFVRSHSSSDFDLQRLEEFGSKGRNYLIEKWEERSNYEGSVRGSRKVIDGGEDGEGGGEDRLQPSIKQEMPPMIVMMKLILLLCAGINRYVARFVVPVLGFNFIATSNLYEINYKFIAADTLQKIVVLLALEVIVFLSVIWYNLLSLRFEYWAAKILINERFPGSIGEITSIRVESDVVSLSGIEPLETDAEWDVDGSFHVRVRRSPLASLNNNSFRLSSIWSDTTRASNLSGVEIYLVQSSPVGSISSFHYAGREPVSGVPINPMFLWSGTQGLAGGSVKKHETEVPPYISGVGGAIGHRRTSSNSSATHEPRSLPMHPTVNGSFGGSDNFVRSHSSSYFDLQRLEEFGKKGHTN
ncbi:auxin efflux carrier component 2-like [Punica granatum]|uniref:Auxin efflux carrier component 2-like n=1 Tax=Punica granatum TaxID=22663 RepID=A0A6P8DGB8_PUNGR|nr:auxin efflux carrier component 2-like [Punica granatum]